MKRPLLPAFAVALMVATGSALWRAHAFRMADDGRTATVIPVQAVPTDQVLTWIAEGKRVVFVDARESQEFDEEHIPGALNVSLHELQSLQPEKVAGADLIVAYCLKDFRGYEVAKALHRAGFPQSVIMKEYGIAGWKKQGLPTVARGGVGERIARERLAACARSPRDCVKTQG